MSNSDDSSMPGLPPVKKRKLSMLWKAVILCFVVTGSVIVLLLYVQDRKMKAAKRRPAAEQPVQPESVVQQRLAAGGYGDEVPPVAPQKKPEPSKDHPEEVAPKRIGGQETTQVPTKKEASRGDRADRQSGSERAPEIVTGNEAAASGQTLDNTYGDAGDGFSASERLAQGAGRPMMGRKEKDQKPEQYFADVTPWPKRNASQEAGKGRSGAVSGDGTAGGQRKPAFGRGKVLGGPSVAEETEDYAPAGRVIPCELIFAVDSTAGSSGASIIGITTEDLKYEGRVIIPKGSEVLGMVGQSVYESDSEGRIMDAGEWKIVMPRQPGRPAGRELRLRGSAHMRKELVTDADGRVRQWDRVLDGRPGLPGKVYSLRDGMRWKKLGMDVLGAVAKESLGTLKDQRSTGGLVGGYEDSPTMKNVGVSGAQNAVGAATSNISQDLAERYARMAEYVLVEGGTPFYLFVNDTILPAEAVAGRKTVEKK